MKIIYVSLIGLFLLTFVVCGNTDVHKFTSGEATALVYNWVYTNWANDSNLYELDRDFLSNNLLHPLRQDPFGRFGSVNESYLGNGKWAVEIFSNGGFNFLKSKKESFPSEFTWEHLYNNYDGRVFIFIVYEQSQAVIYKGQCGKELNLVINPCDDLQKTFK
tara:strand:+ start:242 stop:727 length:486 start_codon:yes stop_codon:yes gene_type:complete